MTAKCDQAGNNQFRNGRFGEEQFRYDLYMIHPVIFTIRRSK